MTNPPTVVWLPLAMTLTASLAVAQTPVDTLRAPPTLADLSAHPDTVLVELVAARDRLELLPGRETDVWAYNGSIPGPTLEVEEGDHVIIRFRNELPEVTTAHWHGIHLPFRSDGSPFHPVPPGGEYIYEFTVEPGTAGTYLYHPHPNHRTSWQVGMGLYGAIIVRDPDDPLPPMPEKLLVVADNRFRPDGSIAFADPDSEQGRIDEMNGREGDVVFVNGQLMPRIPIREGEVQRWRVVNASGARIYRLSLPGHRFLHVGSDGGLFERPVDTTEVVLANTERAELLVPGTGRAGERVALQDLPYDRYMPLFRPEDWEETRELLTLEYVDDGPVAPVTIPATLRHVPAMDEADAEATRLMLLSNGRINSKVMDMDRIDVSARLGATEIWQIENLVDMDHPFHLHGFRFQVVTRNGDAVPYRRWEDTVNVPKKETVRFIVRYEDYPGLWMFHCHILEHEDQGMMGILEVK